MLNYVDPATGSEVLELEEVPSREQYASRVGSNGSSGIQARGLTERLCSNTVVWVQNGHSVAAQWLWQLIAAA